MLTDNEKKLMFDAVKAVGESIRSRTDSSSDDRENAFYDLQELCDVLASMIDMQGGV